MPRIERLLRQAVAHDETELSWEPGRVVVLFPDGRRQVIRYREAGKDRWLFTTTVAPASVVAAAGLEAVAQRILLRNRETEIVTFGLGRNHRLEAWICHRASTLQPEELRWYLVHLAREADRLEHLLSGEDQH